MLTVPADYRRSKGHTVQGDGRFSSRRGTGRRIQRVIEILRSSALGEVPHGFLGRRVGVSIGIYAGLNVGLGSADDHSTIVQNRILAREAVLPGSLLDRKSVV